MITGHYLMSGQLWHRRQEAPAHAFGYPLLLLLVDLAEPDTLVARHPLWGRRRSLVSLRDEDYVSAERRPLMDKVRDKAAEQGLDFRRGQVLMLAQPRVLGCLFNPLVLYFHIPPGADAPDGVLAEVRNTPWGENHFYAHAAPGPERRLQFQHDKNFHVSPFLPPQLQYHWHIGWHRNLMVRIGARDGDRQLFEAGMRLESAQAHRTNMASALSTLIHQGLLTRVRIYRQAWRLWRRRAPFHAHPDQSVREEK